MSSNVKSDAVCTNYQGNTASISIEEIIGEMKTKFNKPEHKIEVSKTKKHVEEDVDIDIKVDKTEATSENEEKKSEILEENHPARNEDNPIEPTKESHLFKKPNDEFSQTHIKETSPIKKSVNDNDSDVKGKSTIKRSLRCRGKNSSESILQSAIARKEKSYNESNKPQRLSRQRRSKTILDSIKQVDKLKPTDPDLQLSDEASTSDSGTKKPKIIKMSHKKVKRSKFNCSDGIESDSLESISDDSEILKYSLQNHTRNISSVKEDDTKSTIQSDVFILNSDFTCKLASPSTAESELIASRACLCTDKTNLYPDIKENETMYCTAIDSIEDKLVGCSRIADVKNIPLLRPSRRVPYQIMCDFHKNRLIRHNCCPTCGIFCTQGRFVECSAKHHCHRKCQISFGTTDYCPHCGIPTPNTDVSIELHCDKKPIFLPTQKPNYPTAKMSFLPVEDHDLSSRTSPPLLPPETFKNLSQLEVNGCRFTDNDLVEAIREDNEMKMAAIIASDTVDLRFKIADFNNGTLLHYSAFHGLLAICHLLLLAHFEIDEFDKEQNTPLMLAISSHKNDVVNYLIRAGANVSLRGTDGMTALHTAAKCGNLDAIKHILRSSTNANFINCQDDGGWTPLVWACEHGHIEILSYLISLGANLNLRDVEYNEALHWAAFSGSCDVLELLLNAGCDVNTVNVQGETPLHIAAREDRSNCIIMLLARGADVSIANKNNETPIDYVSTGSESYNILLLNLKLNSVIGKNGPKAKTILSNDISRGREPNPIQCVNSIDDEPEPKNFVYITKNCISQDYLSLDKNITSIHSCSCTDDCVTSNCSCTKKSKKLWYDEEGKLSSDFNFEDAVTLFECNDTCKCNAITCRNRVVQKGLTQRFQIFKTEQKGWGLKTLRFIPKGTFVSEYVGEILTDTEADAREDDSFLFALCNGEEESYCVDARRYGNISRFINHSCLPNLYPIKLFVEHQDSRFPRISLFAQRDILADEELSFDYGQRFWEIKYKFGSCKCNVPECKYSNNEVEITEDCGMIGAKESS